MFRGIERAMPILHGSQGCATYIRRYLISHFREPLDVASSNFSESSAVFGGQANLHTALDNVIRQYRPSLVGVATTCLSETIGEDVPAMLRRYRETRPEAPPLVHVSTPSFSGTHMDGFHAAVRAIAASMPIGGPMAGGIPGQLNVFPPLISPEDIRYLKQMLQGAGITSTILPDYSETLDGVAWDTYQPIPEGGTPVADLCQMGRARRSIQLTSSLQMPASAAGVLHQKHGVPAVHLHLPIGVRLTDTWWDCLTSALGILVPPEYTKERGRLIDSYVDGHKYVSGARAVVYGEEDLVAPLAGFLSEIGIQPVLCASGGKSGRLASAISDICGTAAPRITVRDGMDFQQIADMARDLKPNLLIGSSKGYRLARELSIPLIRVGFPIHDRFGAQRTLHVGYRGAQQLFDRIVCAIQEKRQETSDVGYAYL